MRRMRREGEQAIRTQRPRPVRNAAPPGSYERMVRLKEELAVGGKFAIRGSASGTGAQHLVRAVRGQHRFRPSLKLRSRSDAYPLAYRLGQRAET